MLYLLGFIIILVFYIFSIVGGIVLTAVLNYFFNDKNS